MGDLLDRDHVILWQGDLDEGDDSRVELVLGSLHDDDELLLTIGAQLDGQILLELLGSGVFDEPAIVLDLRVLDQAAILVLEWQLLPVVRPKYLIAVEVLVFANRKINGLIFV